MEDNYITYLYQEIEKYCDIRSLEIKKYVNSMSIYEYYIELITDYKKPNTKIIIPLDRKKYLEAKLKYLLYRSKDEIHKNR